MSLPEFSFDSIVEEVKIEHSRPQTEDLEPEDSTIYFKNAQYESNEMRKILALNEQEEKIPIGLEDVTYKQENVFPDWVLSNSLWKNNKPQNPENEISDILNIQVSKRSAEQVSTLIHWLMSVWKIANTMGYKRCGAMFKEFKYIVYQPNEIIIKEGERGLVFYIIISGNTVVHKKDIGVVGHLGKGKSFGEIALTQGKDLRTATIIAETKVEVLSLHKENYDFFVRDIQEAEKRENFQVLTQCKLFKQWPKGKIEKMSNSCLRKTYEAGSYIFHQGDQPEDLFVVVEGSVNIVKELVIVCKNRWPTSIDTWTERTKKIHKPMCLNTLTRNDYFGEVAIIKNQLRSTSAIAVTRTILISLDKLEFLHLISYGNSTFTSCDTGEFFNMETINKYVGDDDVIKTVEHVKGGPSSEAIVGDAKLNKYDIDHKYHHKDPPKQKKSKKKLTAISHNNMIDPKKDSLNAHMMKIAKGEEMISQLKKTAADTLHYEKIRKEKLDSMSLELSNKSPHNIGHVNFKPNSSGGGEHHYHNHHGSMSGGHHSNSFHENSLIMNQSLHETSEHEVNELFRKREQTSFFKNRLELARRVSSMGFGGGHNKRVSLAGIDNDASYTFDGRVILRKNSAIHLDKFYDQLYMQMQTPDGAKFLSDDTIKLGRRATRASSIFTNIAKNYNETAHLMIQEQQQQYGSYNNSNNNNNRSAGTIVFKQHRPSSTGKISSPINKAAALAAASKYLKPSGIHEHNDNIIIDEDEVSEASSKIQNNQPFSPSPKSPNSGNSNMIPGSIYNSTLFANYNNNGTIDDYSQYNLEDMNDNDFIGSKLLASPIHGGSGSAGKDKIRRKSSYIGQGLKYLNKAKISYREAMEG